MLPPGACLPAFLPVCQALFWAHLGRYFAYERLPSSAVAFDAQDHVLSPWLAHNMSKIGVYRCWRVASADDARLAVPDVPRGVPVGTSVRLLTPEYEPLWVAANGALSCWDDGAKHASDTRQVFSLQRWTSSPSETADTLPHGQCGRGAAVH